MNILVITPESAHSQGGNRMTALRYERILKDLGHRVTVDERYDGRRCDLMIALHARRSSAPVRRFRAKYPDLPLVVVLTGTDVYRDIQTSATARRSLELATRLVVLQENGLATLPEQFRPKTRIIYQSATRVQQSKRPERYFKVSVIGHLRPEKDPFRAALAVRLLPASSRVRVFQVGRALNERMKKRALHENARSKRYRWLGEMSYGKTRRLLAGSHLLALTSRIEGSSNVLCEALASSVPVVASRIPGLIGTLGEDYPGYFPVGDTHALAKLLERACGDARFYEQLKSHCIRLELLVAPEWERAAWKELLAEIKIR